MELEFDKEIDALLRNAQAGRGVLVGDTLNRHLDADEVAAFAENALPAKARQKYTLHLADCDYCRTFLSELISANVESRAAAVPPIAAPAEIIPWYRKLFLFPNLAYVMGSLVLVFSGVLGYSILRNSAGSSSSEVSRINDAAYTTANANFNSGSSSNSNVSGAMSNMSAAAPNTTEQPTSSANSAANNAPAVIPAASPEAGRTRKAIAEKDLMMDGADAAVTAPPPAKKQPVPEKNATPARPEPTPASVLQELRRSNRAADTMRAATLPAPSAPMMKSQKEPTVTERSDSALSKSKELTTMAAPNSSSANLARRHVGGKTFERRQNVWYEAGYRGQTVIGVRRGTEAYKKLDSGLRIIAERLSGTVVVFWKKQAYRIQ